MTEPMNRRDRRRMKAAGVAAVSRIVIEHDAIVKAAEKGVDMIDIVMLHVDSAMHSLIDEGGDVLRHTVITIGAHPDFPGDVTIEAKTAHMVKPGEPEPKAGA